MLHGAATAALVGYCLKQHHPFQATLSICCLIAVVTGTVVVPGHQQYICGGFSWFKDVCFFHSFPTTLFGQ